ncbi:type II glyceraldehyde-3-phosphate dehydrogenase [Polaromonas sp. AER18D-145]|uniref:type II glyceraldehyde-3-phosphate dehydrogenase n=1 Tax=Polaromonas sp. AER18D-145 TaxID=1977060 RepID=UPI000BBC1826|nr:type II glyceraldehyde-3-phosphate dehydrogenase [Polaromonas sp. AER18D-145]
MNNMIQVGIVGYGVIGKRVAKAIKSQPDMALAGVADVAADWRILGAVTQQIPLYAADASASQRMREAGFHLNGSLDDLLGISDIVVDCTPKRVGASNAERYRAAGKAFILHGGEKHEVTGHSFVAEANYASAVGRPATRVVSCNTTSIVRTLGALKRAGLLKRARGTLLRRATDPWESHLGGIINTVLPEPSIPSHQGPDARSVDPDLDVVTMAVAVPTTIAHVHYWAVDMTRSASKEEVLEIFSRSSRIALIKGSTGLTAPNVVKELMADSGRPHDSLYEVGLWSDMLHVEGAELFYAYMVDNQAIVIPETIDAIRALGISGVPASESIAMTDASLGVGAPFASKKWPLS